MVCGRIDFSNLQTPMAPAKQSDEAFIEGFAPQQKVVDGVVFPKILLPHTNINENSKDESGILHSLHLLREHKAWLQHQLYLHGAILFRGFGLTTPQDFNAFVKAFGWEEMPYIGMARRSHVIDQIYTANEAPLDSEIFFHQDMSQIPKSPSKIFLFCEIKAPDGGQTPILMAHKVTERLEKEFPEFVRDLEEKGLRVSAVLDSKSNESRIMGRSWQDVFGTVIKKEAEERDAKLGARLEWLREGKVKVIQDSCKPIRIFDERGRKSWFNTLAGMYDPSNDSASYGDGSRIPEDAVEACRRIQQEEAVDMEWERGDVMLVDNRRVMHGRRKAKPPRKVLVALCA